MTAFPTSTWIRPPRQRTGVLGLGVLALVASTWLLVPQSLVLWDALLGGIGVGDLFEQGASAAVPATLVLAAAAVSTRIVWLLVLAIPTLAVHGLVLVVVAIVAGASGAPGLAVLAHLGDAFALLLALLAVIVALVATAAARAGDRPEGAGWYAALVLAGLATMLVIAAPYLLVTRLGVLQTFAADTLVIAGLVATAFVAGIRSPIARWAAVALAMLTALWIVLLQTLVLPATFAALIAIASVRAVLLVLAAALIGLSTRWLAAPTGTAPPVVPPRAPAAPTAPPVVVATPVVAPPVVPEPAVANPAAATPSAEPTTEPATSADAAAPVEREHAPGVVADADDAIDQGDREVPEDAPTAPPSEGDAR